MGIVAGKSMLRRFAPAMIGLVGRKNFMGIYYPPANIDSTVIADLSGVEVLNGIMQWSVKHPHVVRRCGKYTGIK